MPSDNDETAMLFAIGHGCGFGRRQYDAAPYLTLCVISIGKTLL
jgi:hypothetical protein